MCNARQGKVAHYVFVASAGAYNLSPIEPMHVEGDPRKSSAGHVAVEKYLEEQAGPLSRCSLVPVLQAACATVGAVPAQRGAVNLAVAVEARGSR
jgi:hypothetical protein